MRVRGLETWKNTARILIYLYVSAVVSSELNIELDVRITDQMSPS